MTNARFNWENFFNKVFEEAKDHFKRYYPFKDDGEVSPTILALRDAIWKLPIPIKVLELKVDTSKYPDIKDKICHLIRYDFTKFGFGSVEYLGIIDASDSKKLAQVLIKDSGFEGDTERLAENFCRELTTIGFTGSHNLDIYYQLLSYNIKENFERYAEDFAMIFLDSIQPGFEVSQRFKKIIDCNSLYDLKPDHIIPLSEILEEARNRKWPKVSIEELQQHVASIQLIPPVPEPVQRVFRAAKDLYIFGYFEYHFFTVSEHYAYLALESAIKHRYIKSLDGKAVLTNKKGEKHEMNNPSYYDIIEFCRLSRKAGWNFHALKVNEEDFPWNPKLLLKWLVEKGIIPKWDQQFYDVGLRLRNALSHLEFAPIHLPNSVALERVAEQINKLFLDKPINPIKQGSLF